MIHYRTALEDHQTEYLDSKTDLCKINYGEVRINQADKLNNYTEKT